MSFAVALVYCQKKTLKIYVGRLLGQKIKEEEEVNSRGK
jgi:hypothetical protein